MSGPDSGLQRQLDELSRRLAAVESALGLTAAPPEAWTRAPLEQPEAGPPAPASPTLELGPSVPPLPGPSVEAAPARSSEREVRLGLLRRGPDAAPPPREPARAAGTRNGTRDLKRTIGAKWFAAIGAVVVVVGVALFLKLAYDRGWLDRIPPAGKVISGALFGAALLGAGEVTRRKINALASAGLTAAGVGALYASAYAAHGVYNLIGNGVALVLLAAASGVGIFVAVRARLASVALLALTGAYLAPTILGGAAHPAVLPMYLLALLALGLGLAGWIPRPFHLLRPVVWWATLLLGSAWIAGTGLEHAGIALAFLGAVWGGVHASLAVAARRGGIVPAESGVALTAWRRMRPIAGSFTTTAWCVILGAVVMQQGSQLPPWVAYAAGAGAALMLGSMLAGHLRVLRDVPRDDAERLGAALAVQAGALVIAAVAIGFRGGMEVVAWLALGTAAVGAGRWIGSRGLDVYGLIVLSISAVRLLMLEWWTTDVAATGVRAAGFYLTEWTLLVVLAGIAWLGAAHLLRRGPDAGHERVVPGPWQSGAVISALAVGLTLLAVSVLHARTHFASGATSVLALGAGCAVIAARLRSPGLVAYSAGVIAFMLSLALTRAPWSAALEGDSLGDGVMIAGIVVSWWMYVLLLGGATSLGWALAALRAAGEAWRDAAIAGAAVAVVTLFAAFLHHGASGTSITLIWAGLAVAVTISQLALGRLRLNVLGAVGVLASGLAWGAANFGGSGGVGRWFNSAAIIGLHPGLWTAAVVTLAGIVVLRLLRWWPAPATLAGDPLPRVVAGALVTLMLCATSAEAARLGALISADPAARGAAVSVWWGLFAAGLLAYGFRAAVPIVRHVGLGLLLLATIKAAVFDLAGAPQEWRVASFIGLGLLMLGVAVVYSKLSARLAGEGAAAAGDAGAGSEDGAIRE